ncbi:peptidase S12 family protein, partial [Streptomyces sp. NPDC058418]
MPVPFTADDTSLLKETFEGVVADGATPGGVIAYGTTSASPQFLRAGMIAPECGDEVPFLHTAYDIASLTKVVATWPLVGQALDVGLLDLDEPIRDFLPAMNSETPSANATV